MKQYKFLSTALFLAAMVAWSGCSNEDESLPAMSGTEGLVINVCDKGMENAESSASRAVTDLNYNTTFEVGDCIGLFAVKDNAILSDVNNLRVQLTREGWQPATDLQYDGALREATYYACFPYSENLSINSVETDFFASTAAGWNIGKDQSTRKNFADSDLMTSSGSTVYRGDKGEFLIQFNMVHRMSLAVISLPGTEYKFTNPELKGTIYAIKPGGDVAFYTEEIASGKEIKPYRADDGSYRMLVKPAVAPDIVGVLGDSKYNVNSAIAAGKYKRFMVDGGNVVKEYELKVGDYYCADGNLVSRDCAPEEVPDDCIGIVYYVGNPQPSVLYKETLEAVEEKDALKRDYPNCVHGLVYAINQSNATATSVASNSKLDYAKYFTDNGLDSRYFWGNGNKVPEYGCILGYNNTEALKEMHVINGNAATNMISNISTYSQLMPAPSLTSGWYLPSVEELDIIFENKDDINSSLANVGGTALWIEAFAGTGYQTSTNTGRTMYRVLYTNETFGLNSASNAKGDSGFFRFSLAF